MLRQKAAFRVAGSRYPANKILALALRLLNLNSRYFLSAKKIGEEPHGCSRRRSESSDGCTLSRRTRGAFQHSELRPHRLSSGSISAWCAGRPDITVRGPHIIFAASMCVGMHQHAAKTISTAVLTRSWCRNCVTKDFVLQARPEALGRFGHLAIGTEDATRIQCPMAIHRAYQPVSSQVGPPHRFRAPADAVDFEHHGFDTFVHVKLAARTADRPVRFFRQKRQASGPITNRGIKSVRRPDSGVPGTDQWTMIRLARNREPVYGPNRRFHSGSAEVAPPAAEWQIMKWQLAAVHALRDIFRRLSITL